MRVRELVKAAACFVSCFMVVPIPLRAQIVTSIAGGGIKDGIAATSAPVPSPYYAIRDRTGNLLISEYSAHRVRKVNTAGIISTTIGNGISGFSGDGGPASAAMVSFPYALLYDSNGNLFLSDYGNNRVRKVNKSGVITTIAGNGTGGYTGDGGPATAASLNGPRGLAFDASGTLYISDSNNNVVRTVDASGIIRTVAGNGVAGFSGDGGPAVAASLNEPFGIVLDRSDNLYIADALNHRVRRVDQGGQISTFAGSSNLGACNGDGGPATQATLGFVHDLELSKGMLLISNAGCTKVRGVNLSTNIINTVAGVTSGFNGDGLNALFTDFDSPHGLSLDAVGNQIIVDSGNNRVRVVNSTTNIVSTIAGGFVGDNGPATQASLYFSAAISFDPTGNLFIADEWSHRVRKVNHGVISTIAGTGISGYTGDGGPAVNATLYFPYAVANDGSGNTYLADQAGGVLRKIDSTGIISTLQLSQFIIQVTGLAIDRQGNLYAADAALCVVWKISPKGVTTAFAGIPGTCGYNQDGIPATQAWMNSPWGVALDSHENVFIADLGNNRVRKVDGATGLISTVAGEGDCTFGGDGGPATSAMLCFPTAAVPDRAGNLYIADSYNYRIRKVDSAGIISTLAGTGTVGYNGDKLPALQTNIDNPNGLAFSPSGTLYYVDQGQSRVRKVQ
jgi:sugar lactone lactonase YvrE